MSKIIMKNEKTGEIFESHNFQNEPSSTEIMRMTYQERLELYNNDRSRYDHLMSKIAPEPCRTKIDTSISKPWDYQGGRNRIIRKED